MLLGVLLHAGALYDPAWSTMDDGHDLVIAAEFQQKLSEEGFPGSYLVNCTAKQGLFRPLYPVIRFLEFRLLGFSCWTQHFAHLLVMLGVCQLLYSIARGITGSAGIAWMAGALFTLFSPNTENWFKLGDPAFYPHAVAVLSLWIVARTMSLSRERGGARHGWMAMAIVILPLAYFTKETSIGLLGMPVGILVACGLETGNVFVRRNLRLGWAYLAGHLTFAASWFVLKHVCNTLDITSGNYTQNYRVSLGVFAVTGGKYADVFWNGFQFLGIVALVCFAMRLWGHVRGRRLMDSWDGCAIVGFCWLGSTLALILPWTLAAARYLLPGMGGLCLFVAPMLLRTWTDCARGRALWIRALLLANALLLPPIALCRNINFFMFRHDYDRTTFSVIETVARHLPRGGRIYENTPTVTSARIFSDIPAILGVIFDRPGIPHFNLQAPDRPDPRPGDLILMFSRDATLRSMEPFVPESFHAPAVRQLDGRVRLLRHFRVKRRLPNSYPDAPFWMMAKVMGFGLRKYVGEEEVMRRGFFMWQDVFVDWRVYQVLPETPAREQPGKVPELKTGRFGS